MWLIAIALVVLVTITTSLVFRQLSNGLRASLLQDSEHELKSLTVILSEPAALQDYPTIKQLLINRYEQGDLTSLRYVYRNIDISPRPKVVQSARPEWFAKVLNIRPPAQHAEIALGGVSYGSIDLINDPSVYEDSIWKSLVLSMFILGFGLILLLVAVNKTLSSNLKGLTAIRRTSNSILQGHYDRAVELPDHASPELVETADAIDEMRQKLGNVLADLKTQEERWSFALEGAGDGVWDWDMANNTMVFSKRWYQIQGFEEGSVGPEVDAWRKLVHPEDLPVTEAALQAHFRGETGNFSCVYRVMCKNGEYKWILGRGMLVSRDSEGKPLRAIGTHTDINERKQADEERERLLHIIMDASDFIASADMGGHLFFLNPSGAKLVGLPVDCDLTSLQIKDMHPEWATRKVLEEGVPAALQHGYWQSETALLNKLDGREIPVSQLLLLHRDANGVPQQISTIMRDISSFKQAEQTMRQAKEAAEAHAYAKSEFLANMSHEIRTPMNGIIGLTQLALNKECPTDIRDYLEKISSSSQSLLGILNDILDFSKLEAGRMQVDQASFDLDNVLDNLRNLFEERAEAKQLVFDIDVSENTPRDLIGDALRIQQILSNLIGNAIKFTLQGKVRLAIGVKQLQGSQAFLTFTVADTGIGMSEAFRNQLFQPFSQADGSITRKFGGTGLGLAISQNLLRLMGGEFEVASQPDQGTSISFELRLSISSHGRIRNDRHREKHEAGKLEHELQEAAKNLKGVRILVAEDNKINQQVVKEFLKLSGMEVEIANNGQEALDILKAGNFDAILMDMHMPEMDGVQATKLIRSGTEYAGLPIIALTAGVTQEERDSCMSAGMNDFVTKPINPGVLLSSLSRWIK